MLSSLANPMRSKSNDLGAEIIKVVLLDKEWRIKFQGSYWTAQTETPTHFKVGDRAHVLGHKTIGDRISTILLIAPL